MAGEAEGSRGVREAEATGQWTWWLSLVAVLAVVDLLAVAWYFQQLPEARFKNWEKILGTLASWAVAVIAYLGIRYKVGDVHSVADVCRLRPVQLCIVVVSVLTWYFVLPFHSITVTVGESGSGKALEGATVTVEGETAARLSLSDKDGRIAVNGLLATAHKLRFQMDGYQEWPATVGFMDVLLFRHLQVRLRPMQLRVEFRTSPAGADVYLDGDEHNLKGHTPLTLVLSKGHGTVMFKKDGHRSTGWEEIRWEEIPEAEGTRLVERVLVRKQVALHALTVVSEPSGADILVGGKLVSTTPDTVMLAAGSHRVELRRDGRSAVCVVRLPDRDQPKPICFRRLSP